MNIKPTKIFKKILKTILLFAFILITFALGYQNLVYSQTKLSVQTDTISQQINQKPAAFPKVKKVSLVGITVSDTDRAVKFYSDVLSFRKISDVEVFGDEYEYLQGLFGVRMRIVQMQLGDEIIELTEYLTPKGRPIPIDSRSNDLWFQHLAIVVSDIDKAYQHLRKFKVQHVSTAPQRLPEFIKAAAGIEAFYFRDPDGHNLEIIHFPPDKGNPRWQKPTNKLFLGIDHTAIAVSNTETSLKFYRDLLGLELIGESENYGTQQEHLNNVFGARLRISGLSASNGPGIEFLEYLTPGTGRPTPEDTRPNDLIHWETTLIVDDVKKVAKKLRSQNYSFLSSDVIELPSKSINSIKKGFLVRDPDGHVMRIGQN